MAFVVAAVLIAGVLIFTLVIRRQDLPAPAPVSPTFYLEERKRAIYEGLRDLQFEYRMGKLSDQDYSEIKLDLQRQLAAVLDEMEKIPAKAPGTADSERHQDDAPTAAVASPAAAGSNGASGAVCVCPHCAAQFSRPMKFCGECGRAIAPAVS